MGKSKTYTNNLRIALIKKKKTGNENKELFNRIKDIINLDKITEKDYFVFNNKYIFYQSVFDKKPKWVKIFFDDLAEIKSLKTASARAVLLSQVDVNENEKRIFAVFFGYGRNLIKKECLEENFGLKVVLNCCDRKGIRSIEKTELTNNTKKYKEQMPSKCSINDFGFNFESDLIESITCKVKDDVINGIISGNDVLTLSKKVSIENIDDFLVEIYMKYKLEKYKENFEWIDNIKCIKNPSDIAELNGKLIKCLNSGNNSVKMAVPEYIDWTNIDHFEYRQYENEDDIYLEKI